MKIIRLRDESKRKGPKGLYPQGQLCLTPNGHKFHYRHCRTLGRSPVVKPIHPGSPAEVFREARSRDRCKVCRPPAGAALKVVGESILDHALMAHDGYPRPVILERKLAPAAERRGWRATDYGTRKGLIELARERFTSDGFIFTVMQGTAPGRLDAALARYESEQEEALQVPEPRPKLKLMPKAPQDPFRGFGTLLKAGTVE